MSFIQLLQRSYLAIFDPPDRGAKDDAVRFGLLGASKIASVLLPSFFVASTVLYDNWLTCI
jgi:hypothetical protein